MNNNLKVVLGTVAGIMIGSLTVVGANQAIQALQNTEIKISLNGQIQEFKDETTGETQYPITYHDRTYLPLRNVAQLSGLSVDYDNDSKTAILTGEEPIDFQYIEKYYVDNNGRIKIVGDGYTDLEKFDRNYKYYLDKTGSLLTIDASSYDMPNNKITYNLTGFYGNVKSCLAIRRKIEMGNLQDILIVALNDSGRVFVLAPSSNSFVLLDFGSESYGERFIEKIGMSHKTISEYLFASETYDDVMLRNMDSPTVYLKDEYGNLILLNTCRNNEKEFLREDNELSIVVVNNDEPLYFSIVNNVKPATKFSIRNIVFKNEEVKSNEIQKIEYWFDNETPKEISREDSIPEVYLSSPYNTLNIKIKYNDKDYQFSYKINPKSFETAGFVEDCIKDGEYYKCKINGVEYTGISREVNKNSFVFLVEMNYNYIPLGITEGSDVDLGRKVTKITEDSIELTDDRGKVTIYKKDELYTRCSIMNYFEVDNNNNFIKNQMSFSRNHPSFTLQVGDTITAEIPGLGLLNIIRKVEKVSEQPFFTYNENAEILVSEPDILYEDSEINFNLTNYLKDNEKLIIKCTCEGKSIEIYNNHYDKKKYVLYANQISKAFNKSYSALNGKEAKIEALICDNDGKVVNNYSFSTYIGKEEPIEITTNFGSIKDNNSKIIISFNREIKEYEEVEINFLLKTSSDGGGRWGRSKPELKRLSNGNIEIDVAELKQNTFDILNDKDIFNLVKEGNEVKAYNILDTNSKDYVINLNEVEISIEVKVMQWRHFGMSSRAGNSMGSINLVNKFSLMEFFEGEK